MNKFQIRTLIALFYVAILTAKCFGYVVSSDNTGVRRKQGIMLKNAGLRREDGNHTGRRRLSGINIGLTSLSVATTKETILDEVISPLRGRMLTNPTTPKNQTLTVGIILPHTSFGVREYKRVTKDAITNLHKVGRGQKFEFLKKYQFGTDQVKSTMMKLTPSPTGTPLKFNSLEIIALTVRMFLFGGGWEFIKVSFQTPPPSIFSFSFCKMWIKLMHTASGNVIF